MCEAALDEAAVLSSIYCGAGEFQLLQQSGQWNFTNTSLLFTRVSNITYNKLNVLTLQNRECW